MEVMAKATASRQKQKNPEEKEKYQAKRVREIKRSKRKVIRVESEEKQDYVKEAMSEEKGRSGREGFLYQVR